MGQSQRKQRAGEEKTTFIFNNLKCELYTGKLNVMFVDIKKSSITKTFHTKGVACLYQHSLELVLNLTEAPLSLINSFFSELE